MMDIFERKETPLWHDLKRSFQNATPHTLDDFMVELYQLGRSDVDGETLLFSDEKRDASLKVAQTLIDFRDRLISHGFPSPLADIVTREHHMALFTKDFIKLSKDQE